MPYLGLVGFLPFAMEARVVVETLDLLRLLPRGRPPPSPLPPSRRLALTGAALGASVLFAALALPLMDRFTFASLYPRVEDLHGLAPFHRADFQGKPIDDCFDVP